jgi:hypothetical protein
MRQADVGRPRTDIHEFAGGFDEISRDPSSRNNVHHGEKQEGLMWCAMVGDLRVPVPTPVGPKLSEDLDVFLEHRSEQAPPNLVRFY